jgi:hypothetical protein
MNILCYVATDPETGEMKPRELNLFEAVREGAAKHGDTVHIEEVRKYSKPNHKFDAVAIWGVKSGAKQFLTDHWKIGMTTLMFDKGYVRDGNYTRVSVDDSQPLRYFQRVSRPPDRFDALGVNLRSHNAGGGRSILFAGSSQKYCSFHGLGDATRYAKGVIEQAEFYTDDPIIYRPKPSWSGAVPIRDHRYSPPTEKIGDVLSGCRALITFGSNAAIDAIVRGIPAIVLGDGIAKPVCSNDIRDIADPYLPSEKERRQWCNDWAYCQWTFEEHRSGEAWCYIREEMLA